jgi:hypothetical protein
LEQLEIKSKYSELDEEVGKEKEVKEKKKPA